MPVPLELFSVYILLETATQQQCILNTAMLLVAWKAIACYNVIYQIGTIYCYAICWIASVHKNVLILQHFLQIILKGNIEYRYLAWSMSGKNCTKCMN